MRSTQYFNRIFVTLILILTVALAACGPTPTPTGPTGPEGAFPVTIEHKFGETTVPSEPERVVTVGFSEQDPMLA